MLVKPDPIPSQNTPHEPQTSRSQAPASPKSGHKHNQARLRQREWLLGHCEPPGAAHPLDHLGAMGRAVCPAGRAFPEGREGGRRLLAPRGKAGEPGGVHGAPVACEPILKASSGGCYAHLDVLVQLCS